MQYDVCVCDMCKKDSSDLDCFIETDIKIPVDVREETTDFPRNTNTVVDYDEYDICRNCLRELLSIKAIKQIILKLDSKRRK